MTAKFEKIEKKSKKRGGIRKGSGRKKGQLSKKTLEKKKIEKAMEQKIMRQVDGMLRSQMSLAKGCSYLYVVRTDDNGRKEKPEIVTNPAMIEAYLAGELEEERDEYYYITTDKPDNLAINSLIDRVFGKPKQKLVGGDDEDEPIHLSIDL